MLRVPKLVEITLDEALHVGCPGGIIVSAEDLEIDCWEVVVRVGIEHAALRSTKESRRQCLPPE